jgi:hypothetical protein
MEKRRKELILLSVGAVILAVALYMTFKPRAQSASAQTSAKTPAVSTTEAGPTQSDEAPNMSGAKQADEAASAAEPKAARGAPGRDPFVPRVPTVVARVPGASANKPWQLLPPRQTVAMSPLTPATFSVMPIGLPGTAPPLAGQQARPAQAAAQQDNRLRVTGIIYGDPTVAIIRKGPARWVVQPGDSAAGYTVESISGRRVVLAAGGRRTDLFLEGRF